METPLGKGDRRPEGWRVLIDAIETATSADHLPGFLSEGIRACISNAESLATDLSVLVNNRRIAAAQFVYATCMEEMGKALILLDIVRADLRQDARLKLLCKAFYNHLKKYGYAKTIYSPGRGRLEDALYLYTRELVEYWPNTDPEDGEPDMPADGIAHREWAIYVDWVESDGGWFCPPHSSLASLLCGQGLAGTTPAERMVKSVLDPLLRADREGMFCPEPLKIIQTEFPPVYISSGSDEEVKKLLERLRERFSTAQISVSDDTLSSNFMRCPLYAAIFEL